MFKRGLIGPVVPTEAPFSVVWSLDVLFPLCPPWDSCLGLMYCRAHTPDTWLTLLSWAMAEQLAFCCPICHTGTASPVSMTIITSRTDEKSSNPYIYLHGFRCSPCDGNICKVGKHRGYPLCDQTAGRAWCFPLRQPAALSSRFTCFVGRNRDATASQAFETVSVESWSYSCERNFKRKYCFW